MKYLIIFLKIGVLSYFTKYFYKIFNIDLNKSFPYLLDDYFQGNK